MVISKDLEIQRSALAMLQSLQAVNCVMQGHKTRLRPHKVWRVPRCCPVLDQTLFATHCEREFTRRFRVTRSTFYYICAMVAPAMQKQRRGGGIPLHNRAAPSLHRLGTGNYLLSCGDLYGMSEAATSIAVNDFCRAAVLKYLKPVVVPRFTPMQLREVARKFKEKHGIPFIIGAIDGSHIPIQASPTDPANFYNRKGFYSQLLQGIVDVDTRFWDWDFGWAGSLHDYTVYCNSREGIKMMSGKYHLYKFIGDAAYPCRTSMYVPFKGSKEQLEPWKAHWNFIQSSTQMCVERTFGILKGRWRILLRRVEMKLENVSDMVRACICLHNLCVMHKDFGSIELVQEAQEWLLDAHINEFGRLRVSGTQTVLDYGKTEVSRMADSVEDLMSRATVPPDQGPLALRHQDQDGSVHALKNGVILHTQLAKQLYQRHLRERVPLPGHLDEVDSDSSDDDEGVAADVDP